MRRDTALFVAFIALFALVNAHLLSSGSVEGNWAGFGIVVAAGLTLAIYSFLYRDNPMFKFAEHLYVGVVAAYTLAQYWYTNILTDAFNPLFRPEPGRETAWDVLVPTVLGLLMLTRFVPRISWLSRISFAFVVGVFSGLNIPRTIASFVLQQVEPTLKPVWTAGSRLTDLGAFLVFAGAVSVLAYFSVKVERRGALRVGFQAGAFLASCLGAWFVYTTLPIFMDTLLILVGVVSVLVYFSFSVEHRGAVGAVSRVGIWFLMISFGASFGYTIMARLSLLIGRMTFLLKDWLHVTQ